MNLIEELRKEEFIQNYLQYRWLDDTRTKYAERFFIMLMAFLGIHFQYGEKFPQYPTFSFLLYALVIFVAIFVAKTLILFRRQQRGHGAYINSIRNEKFGTDVSVVDIAPEYKLYMTGRPVYLTTWVEFVVILLAYFSPFLIFGWYFQANISNKFISELSWSFVIATEVTLFFFLLKPFWIYNFSKSINWDSH